MRLTSDQRDRACGVLLGQAVGDALGVPYEFATPPAADEQAEMKGGGLGNYRPGEWSDDTQMAACIALVSATGADLTSHDALDEIASHFLRWRREGATDIGIQTSHVLRAAGDHGDKIAAMVVEVARRPGARLTEAAAEYAARNPRSAGNGALMRTAIVGLTALDDREHTAEAARAVAALTHADPLAGDSAVLWSEAVRVAVVERRLDLRGGLDLIPAERRDQWTAWIDAAEAQDSRTFTPNGFTVTALQAAWAVITRTPVPVEDPAGGSYACQHLQHALHNAVRIGDDTDTVAAIAGGLLSAYWGQSAIPLTWVRRVHGWPQLRGRDLVRLSILTAMRGADDPHGWPSIERMEYGEPHRPAIAHPIDDGVWLGTENTTEHDATAIVSLFRRGLLDVPVDGIAPENHVEVRLIDSNDPWANPHLDFVLADTAALIEELREEGHRVLVHCVAAQQRTPTVAAAYAVHRGATPDEARSMVAEALPHSRRRGLLWEHATALART